LIEINKIHNIDCLEGLKLLDNNFIDSIVTDPPYELSFMGKKWDSTGIAYNIDVWRECLRVLKPGGYILVAGIGRTHHRVMVSLEDAGFEIRDCIYHLFGSGFPKSMDISKAIDKKFGAERPISKTQRPIGGKNGVYEGQGGNWVETDKIPQTELAKQWEGWGTALKPSAEIWILCRKPLSEKTVVENVLKWGTGGINIDGCRIKVNKELDKSQLRTLNRGKRKEDINGQKWGMNKNKSDNPQVVREDGRFPANVILDEEAGRLLDKQSGISKSTGGRTIKRSGGGNVGSGKKSEKEWSNKNPGFGDVGGASRFFYCAKASRSERGEGNNHPTVKPLKLIKYLITLITPPSGICLDPFEGSGTHAVACKELKYNYIGFEINKEYCEIAENRIKELK